MSIRHLILLLFIYAASQLQQITRQLPQLTPPDSEKSANFLLPEQLTSCGFFRFR
jgi:hypothetical protein